MGESKMAVISLREKAEMARAGSLFLKLLWLDELSNEALNKIVASKEDGDIETLVSLTDEMLSLMDVMPMVASELLKLVEKNGGFVNAIFSAVAERNTKYFTSRFDAFRLEPALLVKRFENAGGFENAVLNSANTLLSESAGLRENLERRKRDVANRGIPQADFPHKIMCALLIGAAFCALVGGIAAGVPLAASGAVTILAVEAPTASTFMASIAGAIGSDCF
jgi:hypothetical protein